MDINKICRVCLEEKLGLNSIFGASVAKMIMACASVVVIEGDGLPSQICMQCTLNVSRAFRFKELCEKSDNTLREYLTTTRCNDVLPLKSVDLLLNDNSNFVNSCSFPDLFLKNETPINDSLLLEQSALSAALEIPNLNEQCLPSLWNLKRTTDFPCNSNENFDNTSFVNALQTFDCDRQAPDDWDINLNNDIDSSTCTKSYIDLDHSSRIISEDRPRKQNETFTCQICGQIFNDLKCFKKHTHDKLNIVEEKKFMCNFCGKRYKDKKFLVLHLRSHNGNRPLKCEICEKTFALPSCLHKHMLIHSAKKKYKCHICDKSFLQSSNLNSHLKIHTGEKPFSCNTCGKCFTYKRNLVTHTRLHDGNKPFICIICNASFTTSTQLKRHVTKHTNEKNYICSHCGQAFRLKQTRDTHIRFHHTQSRPYTCTICPKGYAKASQLRDHMLSHTNDRRHQCTVCNKMFLQKRHLKTHMNTHLGERPHSCMICGRCFANSGTLSTHMKGHKKMTKL